eukprot:CAMPEP_0113471850 /NCGR_PEP_ID=MMETSP0014_2-20120614/17197_1 /TAXON_ID=2857 /ORGANISM="Nitzschia sp." /LENGTH=710 /DNA_ID=CAMNT_0000364511 /DNA_START=38 /DNA_END=2171 /DNA_ORIENTATION=- /assembly_acc=CAM_ASM_000159
MKIQHCHPPFQPTTQILPQSRHTTCVPFQALPSSSSLESSTALRMVGNMNIEQQQTQQLPSKAVVDSVVKLSGELPSAVDKVQNTMDSPVTPSTTRLGKRQRLRKLLKKAKRSTSNQMRSFVDADFDRSDDDDDDGDDDDEREDSMNLDYNTKTGGDEFDEFIMMNGDNQKEKSDDNNRSNKNAVVRIIAADVAADAGVSLSQARKDLALLARYHVAGAVSDDGELMYTFPNQLVSILKQNSSKFSTRQAWEDAWPKIFYGIRVTFGVFLLSSIGLSVATLAAMSASSNNDNDRGTSSSLSMNLYLNDPFLWDWLYFRPYYGYYGNLKNGNTDTKDPSEMQFLDSVFSYVFGDGNPNFDTERKRLSMAAQIIRDNGGAVIAEHLAPILDVNEDMDVSSSYVDESFILPIVTQLGGDPVVTEDGDIVYVFEDLAMSALETSTAPKAIESSTSKRSSNTSPIDAISIGSFPLSVAKEVSHVSYNANGYWPRWEKEVAKSTRRQKEEDSYVPQLDRLISNRDSSSLVGNGDVDTVDQSDVLLENEFKFSVAPADKIGTAGAFGILNLAVVGLARQVVSKNAGRLPGIATMFDSLSPLLLTYALFYNLAPLGRKGINAVRNSRIRKRNTARIKWKENLVSGSGVIDRKLKAAENLRVRTKLSLDDESIVYDTTQPIESLQKPRHSDELNRFDGELSLTTDTTKEQQQSLNGNDQ